MTKNNVQEGYVRIKQYDDWGTIGYRMEGGGAVIAFRQGDVLNVRWPDGQDSAVTLRLMDYVTEISEQGHPPYTVHGKRPVVPVLHNGLEMIVEDLGLLLFKKDEIAARLQAKRTRK